MMSKGCSCQDGERHRRKLKKSTASAGKEDIIVAGGYGTDSVEMFNWRQRQWSPLQSIPKTCSSATSFVYNNHVTIAGGHCSGYVNDMIRLNINPNLDLSRRWMPSYAVKILSRMPEPRRDHSTQLFDDNLLIVGGRTTASYQDNLSSVILYDIKKNECKKLAPLPYEVNDMTTVRLGDKIVVLGGVDIHGQALDTVIIYNVKTEQSHVLPPMRCKRWGCTAVVIGNNIVVLGGMDEQRRVLKSVEAFNFESYTSQELPEMSQARCVHTAVLV
ncbi:galactose oxidase [Paramuricea clavata]|uniref:Galactose oxidase n=1 Tax=Paramuricea clavata TaxID=317549 RepID=A0A6S7KPT4_PARCT|nr:galactose oxidase [Paramuricea clavata]